MGVKLSLLFTTLLFMPVAWSQTPVPTAPVPAATATPDDASQERELEVAVGIDEIVKIDFDFSTKIDIGNEQILMLNVVPQKKEMTFKGIKPGRTSVTIRDNVGDVRLTYIVTVTASGKSQIVSELRELIGDVEGLDIGIRGGKVYVGGEIVVPADITRVNTVLETYTDVLRLVQISPQTQRVIARKMMDELAKNQLKDVTVRVVNRVFWLEGVVSSNDKKSLAVAITSAYLPDRIGLDPKGLLSVKRDDILDFISVNEKKDPPPPPKQVKITSQFVELSKDYSRIFGFKWAPLINEEGGSISLGQDADGGARSTGTSLAATISNLFPKLNSARSAGYARVVQSGMVITKDKETATIDKDTEIPYAIGTGDFTRASTASVGFKMEVTPKILEQEKVEMGIGIGVNLRASVSTSGTPSTTKNNIKTTVVIKSKESAAIGGIVQNQSTTAYDKDDPSPSSADSPPPALFRILRSKNHQISRNQYVMFLTPEIIESATTGTEEIRKKFRRRSQ